MEELNCNNCRGTYMVDKRYLAIACPYCGIEKMRNKIENITKELLNIYKLYEELNIFARDNDIPGCFFRERDIACQIEVLENILYYENFSYIEEWKKCYEEDYKEIITYKKQ